MDTSHPERRSPTFRQFAMFMAAITWFALLLPVGARAAGQLVTIMDNNGSTTANVVTGGSLRVAEFNDPARLPFSDFVTSSISQGGNTGTANVITVPNGQRLVIDTVSVRAALPAGQRPAEAYVQTAEGIFFIPLSFGGFLANRDSWSGSEYVQIYVDPGTLMRVQWYRDGSSGIAFAEFGISGHFVRL